MKNNWFEDKAVEYLKIKGYSLLSRNFFSRFGEIDIIAKDKNTIVFVEVKARRYKAQVLGLEAVDKFKQKKIIKTALFYLATYKIDTSYRFDVLEIVFTDLWRNYNLVKGAFITQEYYGL